MLSDTRNYLNLEKVIYTNMEKDNKFDIPVMNLHSEKGTKYLSLKEKLLTE